MKYLLLLFIDTWYLHLISFHKRVLQSSQRAAFFFLFFIPEIGRRIAIVYVQKKKTSPTQREREKKKKLVASFPTDVTSPTVHTKNIESASHQKCPG